MGGRGKTRLVFANGRHTASFRACCMYLNEHHDHQLQGRGAAQNNTKRYHHGSSAEEAWQEQEAGLERPSQA